MKERIALKKICPVMSSDDARAEFMRCQGEECMMWVTTFKPQPQDELKYDNEGYCAFRKTNFNME